MISNRRHIIVFLLLFAAIAVLFPLCLAIGSVEIPLADVWAAVTSGDCAKEAWRVIVVETRLPATVTAALSCASLAVAGLLLQTAFANPLAGPSILGVSTGSSLGVAIVMLVAGAASGMATHTAVLAGAFIGALAVMAILVAMSAMVRSTTMLLIIGILIGYLSSSAISLLNFFATQEGVHSYVIWGLGNFYGVSRGELPIFALLAIALLLISLLFIKPLNAMLLGRRYAENIGVNTRRLRNWLLLLSGALTALVTAYCGPIAFIGLVVPHVARLALRSSNHNVLLPATVLSGAAVGLFCSLICVLPKSWGVIPVNAITPIIGVPVIIFIILRRRKI